MRKLFDFLLRLFPAEYQHAWRLYNKMPIETIATIEIRDCVFKDDVYIDIPPGVHLVFVFALDCELPNKLRLLDSRQVLHPSLILNMKEIPVYLNTSGFNHAHTYFVKLQHYLYVAVDKGQKRFTYGGHNFGIDTAQALIDYAKARGLMTH